MRRALFAWLLVGAGTSLGGTDAGPLPLDAGRPALNAEDKELLENLDLLENLETAKDLELLKELSKAE